MRSLKASHPNYKELNDLSQRIAWAKNPHMVWEGRNNDLPAVEQKAIGVILDLNVKAKLNAGLFKDFINAREFNI